MYWFSFLSNSTFVVGGVPSVIRCQHLVLYGSYISPSCRLVCFVWSAPHAPRTCLLSSAFVCWFNQVGGFFQCLLKRENGQQSLSEPAINWFNDSTLNGHSVLPHCLVYSLCVAWVHFVQRKNCCRDQFKTRKSIWAALLSVSDADERCFKRTFAAGSIFRENVKYGNVTTGPCWVVVKWWSRSHVATRGPLPPLQPPPSFSHIRSYMCVCRSNCESLMNTYDLELKVKKKRLPNKVFPSCGTKTVQLPAEKPQVYHNHLLLPVFIVNRLFFTMLNVHIYFCAQSVFSSFYFVRQFQFYFHSAAPSQN